jgi:hypothetical protein
VFYETGYAHALNKRVILITKEADDIPFDLKHYSHIVYGNNITTLKSELEKRVRWCVANPKKPLQKADAPLEFFINGKRLDETCDVDIDEAVGSFSVAARNVSNHILTSDDFSLALTYSPGIVVSLKPLPPIAVEGLLTSDMVLGMETADTIPVLDLPISKGVFPRAWISFKVFCRREFSLTHIYNFNLFLYTSVGPKRFPFIISIGKHSVP